MRTDSRKYPSQKKGSYGSSTICTDSGLYAGNMEAKQGCILQCQLNSDSNMQQLVPIAPPGKASVVDSGKELVVVVDPARKSSRGVKLPEDDDLEVKLRPIMENVPVRFSNTSGPLLHLTLVISTRKNRIIHSGMMFCFRTELHSLVIM